MKRICVYTMYLCARVLSRDILCAIEIAESENIYAFLLTFLHFLIFTCTICASHLFYTKIDTYNEQTAVNTALR